MNQTATMRDPDGNEERYADYFDMTEWTPERIAAMALPSQVSVNASFFATWPKDARRLYGYGEPIERLQDWMLERVARLEVSRSFVATHGGVEICEGNLFVGHRRDNLAFIALALLVIDRPEFPARISALISPVPDRRDYLVDLLIKCFDLNYKMAKKYKADKYAAPWITPVLRAIALPPEQRAEALAVHMKSWCRILKPWGWKPKLNLARGQDNLFGDFAFEVALAVCGFDIDDSSFSDHPYYPRDLVAYYRSHVRDSRDAWRARGAGPGVAVAAPAPPTKADLAKSKRKNAARWVELVCDGDVDATAAVIDAIGAVRKFKDCDALLAALEENGQAIHADVKDDETLEAQADGIAAARDLGEFNGPPPPPAGPARCRALLRAFDGFLAARAYRLYAIDLDDDGWHAVAVRAAFYDELLALGQLLGIRPRPPADYIDD
jgi:hypothetical protein